MPPGAHAPDGIELGLNVALCNPAGYPQAITGGRHDAARKARTFPAGVHAVAGKPFKIGAFLGKTCLHITATTNANRRRRPRFRGCHQGIRVIKTLQLSSQQRQRLRERFRHERREALGNGPFDHAAGIRWRRLCALHPSGATQKTPHALAWRFVGLPAVFCRNAKRRLLYFTLELTPASTSLLPKSVGSTFTSTAELAFFPARA